MYLEPLNKRKHTLFILFLLALTAILPRIPWLELPLENDSGANAFIARQLFQGERLYDRFHTAHHLPGIYYTFELSFYLFGDSPTSPKLLMFGFVAVTCWLIYWLGLEFADEMTGILGAIFYGLVSAQELFSGTTAAMEHFANLLLTATMFLLIRLIHRNSDPLHFFWIGILGAFSILFKIIYAAPIASAGFIILAWAWLDRKKNGTAKTFFLRIGAITLGFILPLIFVSVYYASQGLWDRFMLVFKLGFSYFTSDEVSTLGFPRPFGFPLFITGVNNVALLVFGLLGAYRLIRATFPLQTTQYLTFLSLGIWFVLSFASTGIRGGGYEHYVLIVLPPLALAAGFEISLARQRLQETHSPKQAMLSAGVLASLVIFLFIFVNFKLYAQYASYKTGFRLEALNPFLSTTQQERADYLLSHTEPDEFFYLWGNNVQLYYYANRLPPIDILWPDYVAVTGPPQRIFNEKTKYIIVDNYLPIPQWLWDGIAHSYTLETNLAGWDFYRRNEK